QALGVGFYAAADLRRNGAVRDREPVRQLLRGLPKKSGLYPCGRDLMVERRKIPIPARGDQRPFGLDGPALEHLAPGKSDMRPDISRLDLDRPPSKLDRPAAVAGRRKAICSTGQKRKVFRIAFESGRKFGLGLRRFPGFEKGQDTTGAGEGVVLICR